MGEDAEDITIPTVTQGSQAIRRAGLVVFLVAALILAAAAITSLFILRSS